MSEITKTFLEDRYKDGLIKNSNEDCSFKDNPTSKKPLKFLQIRSLLKKLQTDLDWQIVIVSSLNQISLEESVKHFKKLRELKGIEKKLVWKYVVL